MMNVLLSFLLIWGSGSSFATEASESTAPLQVEQEATAPTAAATAAASTEPAEPSKAAAATQIAEDQIPVVLETTKKSAGAESTVFKSIMTLSIVGILLFGVYFFSKRYLGKAQRTNQATDIKVLSQHYLGPKKSLAIIRVAGESILIGVTDQNISLIKPLALLDEEVPTETPANFKRVMDENNEDFSISGIKDFVSDRLKNMRSIQ
jgi:flagellar protein FliO/FliZ